MKVLAALCATLLAPVAVSAALAEPGDRPTSSDSAAWELPLIASRPTEARVSEAAWRRYGDGESEAPRLGTVEDHDLRAAYEATARIQRIVEFLPAQDANRAMAWLATERRDFSEAEYRLVQITDPTPSDEIALSAVRLEIARRSDQKLENFRAIEPLLGLDDAGSCGEVCLFNLALALDRLSLWELSCPTWLRAAAKSSPSWRNEVEARSAWCALRVSDEAASLASRSTNAPGTGFDAQSSRERIEMELLPAWGRAWCEGRYSDARSLLDVATAASATGRPTDEGAQSLLLIRKLVEEGSNGGVSKAAHGLARWKKGLDNYEAQRLDEAKVDFQSSAETLRGISIPLWRWPAVYGAATDYQQGRFLDSLREFRAISAEASSAKDVIFGRAKLAEGLLLLLRGEAWQALSALEVARETFDRLEEIEHGVETKLLLADALYLWIGRPDQAASLLVEAMERRGRVRHPRRRQLMFTEASALASQEGCLLLSAELQALAVAEARKRANPAGLTSALESLARVEVAGGRSQAAGRHIAEASEVLRKIADAGSQEVLLADVMLTKADQSLAEGSAQTVADYTRALEASRATSYTDGTLRALLGLARAHSFRGDAAAAATAVDQGLDFFRSLGTDERVRDDEPGAAATSALGLVEESLRRSLQSGGAEQALATVDWFRRRVLAGDERNWSRGDLGAGVLVIEFAESDGRLLGWLVGAGSTQAFSLDASTSQIKGILLALQRNAARDAARTRRLLGDLFDALLGPVRGRLRGEEVVVFCPSRALEQVPFSALFDKQSQEFLVHRHEIVVSGTLSLFLDRPAGERPGRRAAIVGAAQLSGPLNGHFPPLARVADEVQQIADLYQVKPQPHVTRSELIDAMSSAEVVHFAGHAVPGHGQAPGYLVAEQGHAEESPFVLETDLRNTSGFSARVVFLSSCSTAWLSRNDQTPNRSVAAAVQVATRGSVVGALKEVDDEAMEAFALAFHQRLARGISPSRAFREAEESMMRSGNPNLNDPAVWGAFRLYGSSITLEPLNQSYKGDLGR